MEVENSMECKLSLNSYKIRFVKGSEDYLYRRQALKRAKEVSSSFFRNKCVKKCVQLLAQKSCFKQLRSNSRMEDGAEKKMSLFPFR